MTDAVRTTTLEELITRVAFRLGDAVLLTATKAGTTSELFDQVNIPMGNEDLKRRQIVFTSGTAGNPRGVVRIITETNASAHSLTFSPEMGSLIASGVTAVVLNKRGMGYTYEEYKRAINMAIDDAYPIHRVKQAGTTATFDSGSPSLSIPSTIDEVYAVQYQDDNGDWWSIDKAPWNDYPGWQVNAYENKIIVNDLDLRYTIDGLTVRVLGEGRAPQLSLYSDTTTVHPEWLTARACYHLCLMGLDRDATGMRGKQVLTFQQEAETRLTLIRTHREPSSSTTRVS